MLPAGLKISTRMKNLKVATRPRINLNQLSALNDLRLLHNNVFPEVLKVHLRWPRRHGLRQRAGKDMKFLLCVMFIHLIMVCSFSSLGYMLLYYHFNALAGFADGLSFWTCVHLLSKVLLRQSMFKLLNLKLVLHFLHSSTHVLLWTLEVNALKLFDILKILLLRQQPSLLLERQT